MTCGDRHAVAWLVDGVWQAHRRKGVEPSWTMECGTKQPPFGETKGIMQAPSLAKFANVMDPGEPMEVCMLCFPSPKEQDAVP